MQPFEYPLRIQDTYDSLPITLEGCKNMMDEFTFIYCQLANHDEKRVEKLLIQAAHIKYRYIILLEDHSELSESFVLHYENSLPLMIWKHSYRNAYIRDCDEVSDFPLFDGIVENHEDVTILDTEFEQCDDLVTDDLTPQIAVVNIHVAESGTSQTSLAQVKDDVVVTMTVEPEDEDIWFDAIDFSIEVVAVEGRLEEYSEDHHLRGVIPDAHRFDMGCCNYAIHHDNTEWVGPYGRVSSCYDDFVLIPGSFDPNIGSLISNMTGWCVVCSPYSLVVEQERPVRRDRLRPLSYLALKADVRWLLTLT